MKIEYSARNSCVVTATQLIICNICVCLHHELLLFDDGDDRRLEMFVNIIHEL